MVQQIRLRPKLGSTVNVVGEGAKADTEYSGDNLKTIVSQDGAGNTTITVKMDKNPKFDSITTTGDARIGGAANIDGDATVGGDTHLKQDLQVDGNTNIGGNTTIAGDTHIQQNLQVDGDANIKGDVHAGVGYFNDIQLPGGSLTGRLDKMDTRINRVGAGAAALSALHPQDFDPDNKWDFAAGYGNYKDAHAVAVGAFYRPNEDTMFSVGGSFGGGENMVNAGVTFKLGQKSTVSRSKVSMAKEIIALRNDNLEMRQELDELKNMMKAGTVFSYEKMFNFSDVPKDHWAYQYVKSLADRGYLNGYTDGEFKGDRAMTRYEYAAIVYRALQNGAPVDADMGRSLSEFAPEVEKVASADRFRVDRISGKDNDRHKVERVRVNDKDDKVQNVFRDVYGDYVQK